METIIICKKCGQKHFIGYPNGIVWEEGDVVCGCGEIIEFKNDRLENLYI